MANADVTRRELLEIAAVTGGALVGGQLMPGAISPATAQDTAGTPAPLGVGLRVNGIEQRLTLDPLPPNQWGPFSSSPRWWGTHLAAWWWADGTHTIGEIAALIEREFGRQAEDLDGFFEWLESVGYVRLGTSR